MELKEAFDIIDATLGMFRLFAAEIDNRDPKENFLATPVRSEAQTVINVADGMFNPEIECKEYYNDVDGDREYKMYIVNIRPVCNYIVNEWPSSKAKKIRKLLYVVFRECLDICEEPLKGIIDVAIDEGYSYHMRYNASSQNSRTIESVMLDTIHEMYHALGLTEYAEPESEDPSDDKGGITEDLANSIDWVKLTHNFNLDKIRDIVKTVGRSKREKKIIVKAIYDAESATGNMYKIPYSVDKLLNDLYMENDENHRSLFDASYDASTETLNLDILMKQAINEYMNKHTASDKDIDEIFDSPVDEQIGIGENSDIIDKGALPDDFKTPEAEQLMRKLVNAGLLDVNWQPVNLSIAERGYLADEISSRLQIKSKWKVLGRLWNENSETLRQGKNKAVEQTKTGIFIEKLKIIFG